MLGIPAGIPFALVFSGPFVAIEYLYKKVQYDRGCLVKVLSVIFGFIFGLMLNPLVWIGSAIYLLPRIHDHIRTYFR